MLIGEMDSSGSLNAHSLFHLSEKIRAKAVFQVSSSVQYCSCLIKHFLTMWCGLTSYSFRLNRHSLSHGSLRRSIEAMTSQQRLLWPTLTFSGNQV